MLSAISALILASFFSLAHAEQASEDAAELQAKLTQLQPQLKNNTFKEPLSLQSRQSADRMEGDIYAEIPSAFADVTAAFKSASAVCNLLILHLNVRDCRASGINGSESVNLSLGPKRAVVAGEVYQITYTLRNEAAGPNYFKASMLAPKGPLGTHDYRIVFEAMPISGKKSFVHFGYAYGYGTMAKMAMDLYLATAGRNKIGFTVTGHGKDGQPVYVGGERGSLERNVMRYYLALLAYSSINSGTPAEKKDARLRKWFDLTEQYPAQLHELTLQEYLDEKHEELASTTDKKK